MIRGDRDRVIIAEIISRCWTDPRFLEEFLADPRAHLNAAGMDIPEGVKVEVLQNTPELTYVGLSRDMDPDRYQASGGTLMVPYKAQVVMQGSNVTRIESQFGQTITERFSVDDQGRPRMDRTGPGAFDGWSIVANPDGSTDDRHTIQAQDGQELPESRHGEPGPAEPVSAHPWRPLPLPARPWHLDNFDPDYRAALREENL